MKTASLRLAVALTLASSALPLSAQNAADRRAQAERRLQEELTMERPIRGVETVWLEDMTWMEIRDALFDGVTTVIVPTGGIEQNGPHLAMGKHNYILEAACERIAERLGNALCAPIIKLVPEGGIDEPSGHMRYPGTISVEEETFRAMLRDVGKSLAAHGFQDIVYIGDSGGNQRGMEAVAEELDAMWGRSPRAHFIGEFYQSYTDAFDFIEREFGITEPSNDGIHEDFVITSVITSQNPEWVRWEQRVAADRASINGVSLLDLYEVQEIGAAILDFRADVTAEVIRQRIADRM